MQDPHLWNEAAHVQGSTGSKSCQGDNQVKSNTLQNTGLDNNNGNLKIYIKQIPYKPGTN